MYGVRPSLYVLGPEPGDAQMPIHSAHLQQIFFFFLSSCLFYHKNVLKHNFISYF